MDDKLNLFYKIENTVNGKFYYGVHRTNNPEDSYMGSGLRIKRAIKKYGKENFVKEIIADFPTYEEALDYEIEIVNEELLIDPSCYNLKIGGIGGGVNHMSSKRCSELATKTLTKLWQNPEYRKRKIDEAKNKWTKFAGRNHSEETKQRMSLKHKENNDQKGEKNSQFGTCWINKDQKNIKIKKNELPLFLANGWNKGRKIKK